MAVIADGIELFLHIFSSGSSGKAMCEQQLINAGIGICYVVFAFVWLVVWTKFTDKQFSCVLTASACVQLLGFLTLTIKVRATKSVAGISSKTLEMYCLFFVTRLAATTMRSGYIPVDRSGRCAYQMMDVCSFFLVLQLLWCIHKHHKHTYQAEVDTMPIMPMIPPCVILAYFIHADLNRSTFFDSIWACSTNIDTLAMLPQLWMMSKVGGQVEGNTAHFVAAMCVSRGLALLFWLTAYKDLVASGSTLAGSYIVLANVIQLLLAADFLYYYIKATVSGGKMQIGERNAVAQAHQQEI